MNNKIFAVMLTMAVLLSAFAYVGAGMPQNAFASGPSASASADNGLKIVALSTDKDMYTAREKMNIFLSVESLENISDVSITVSGVKSKKGAYCVSYSNKKWIQTGL